MVDRHIIHLNITDFAVAVERICDPTLKKSPLIVAPEHTPRGLVYDMSEEAYQDGVRKGMGLAMARRCCRRAHVVSPRISLYRKAMKTLVKQVNYYTPLVEQGEEDGHLFMDVTGTHRLFGPPPDIAWKLRKQMKKETGLDPVWSLAATKLVAKVASRVVRPYGEYIVGVGEEHAFLAPLPLTLLPGLKPVEMKIMAEFNLRSIGDLARLSREQLQVPFQKRSSYLYEASRGRDVTPVLSGEDVSPSCMQEHAFAEDTQDRKEINYTLMTLVHDMGRSLRQKKMLSKRLVLVLSYSDGRSVSRQALQKNGTDDDFMLRTLALTALERAWKRRIRIRSLVLVCDRFVPRSPQQTLFVVDSARKIQQRKIMAAMDSIYDRFGEAGIRLGGE